MEFERREVLTFENIAYDMARRTSRGKIGLLVTTRDHREQVGEVGEALAAIGSNPVWERRTPATQVAAIWDDGGGFLSASKLLVVHESELNRLMGWRFNYAYVPNETSLAMNVLNYVGPPDTLDFLVRYDELVSQKHMRASHLSYDKLVKAIPEVPKTYLPALLSTLVDVCCEQNVFIAGGLEEFVHKAVRKANQPLVSPHAKTCQPEASK